MHRFRNLLPSSSATYPIRPCTTLHNVPRRRLPAGCPSPQIRALGSATAIKRDIQPTYSTSSVPDTGRGVPPNVSVDERKLIINWSTNKCSKFHSIWLRDHCRCPNCFHPITKQRLLNTFNIPADVRPLLIQPNLDGLEVTWQSAEPQHHLSFYPWSWLQSNSYDPPAVGRAESCIEKIEWGAKIAQSPPTITYTEAMNHDDRGLLKWLTNIDQFGFSFISGVPPTPEATEGLVERIGFIRETQYGRFWDFTSDLAKGDTAYTTLALGAHTDNTYYTDPAGLQLFHLLSHTGGSGGVTLLADGFYVASILKKLYPEYYEILSRIPVPAHAAGETSSIYRPSPPSGYPVLGHDPCTHQLVQVRWNNDDRSVMNHLEPDLVEKWYDAIKAWTKCLTSPDSEYWVQLQPGTAVVVDNHRVLHGRSAFDGERRMCGAYVGVDEYRSKLAVLRERFALDADQHLPQAIVNGRSIWSPDL